jgi:hypothetical protein
LEEAIVLLRHGTTMRRAEAILRNGPNLNFKEPGGPYLAEGFSAARVQTEHPQGMPEEIAAGKARLFPTEGGPAIIELEVPESIVRQADLVGEVRFEPGFGFEELLAAWPSLTKRIVVP